MIGPGVGARVMVATRPVDFRKGPDALAALVGSEYGGDPYSGVITCSGPSVRTESSWSVGRHWPVPDGQEAGVRRLQVSGHQDGVMRVTAAQLRALTGAACMAAAARLPRRLPVEGAFAAWFTVLMLME